MSRESLDIALQAVGRCYDKKGLVWILADWGFEKAKPLARQYKIDTLLKL